MHTEVAITGRLSSMSREEAIQRIRAAGQAYAATPRVETTMLVVGQDGPPIGEDGQLTHSLRQARALQDAGHGIRIVSEAEWLPTLGVDVPADGTLHSAAQLARLVGVPRVTIRAWVRQGLLHPAHAVRRLQYFGFRELAHARALKTLLGGGAQPGRIRSSLAQLRRWLPQTSCGPSQLDQGDDDALVVRTEDGRWAEASGQLRLDFEDTRPVREPRLRALRPMRSRFEQGIQAEEEGRLEDAAELYERSIALTGPRAEVCFNLGNVLYGLERRTEAASRFREATALESDYVEAWNNLGNVLAQLGEVDEALRAFRHALAVEPYYADAHFNLAETLSDAGQMEEARKHWRVYLSLDSTSEWADEARRRLNE